MPRRTLDKYYTGESAVKALRDRVEISGTVHEPCVGEGHIARYFSDCRVLTNDIDPNCVAGSHLDARTMQVLFQDRQGPWIVTNPPFNQAFPILTNFFSQGTRIALLLRLSFLEPTFDRGDWLEAHPPTGMIVLPRSSFTGDGKTDSVTTFWGLWHTEPLRPMIQIVSKGPKPEKIKRK